MVPHRGGIARGLSVGRMRYWMAFWRAADARSAWARASLHRSAVLCRKPYNRRQRYRPGSVSVLRCWCSLRTTGWLLGAVRSSRTRCGGGPVPRLPRDDALPRGARRHGGGARGWGSCQSVGRARRTSDHESHKSRRPCRWRPPRNAISGAPCQRWYHALVGRFTMAPAKLELTQPDLDRPGCSHLGNSNVSMPRAAPHPSRLRGQHT